MITMTNGDTVRVVRTAEMCCGVVMQGNVSKVKNVIRTFDEDGFENSSIVVLEDYSLHWLEDVEKV
jgi:hypothetical protein